MNPPSGRFRTCVLLRPGVSYPWTCRTAIEDSRRGCAPRRRAGEPRVDTSPELEAPLARARREADRRAPDPGGESRECLAGGVPTELVDLGGHHRHREPDVGEEGKQLVLLRLEPATDVDDQHHASQRGALAQVALDERAPGAPLLLAADREPVAG